MTLYLASYLECIHDGSWHTLSVHKTKKGAQTAVDFHKEECEKEHKLTEIFAESERLSYSKFGDSEKWNVFKSELKE